MQEHQPKRRTVMIREVDVETWVALRAEAARRRWTTAAVLEHIVREWMDTHQQNGSRGSDSARADTVGAASIPA